MQAHNLIISEQVNGTTRSAVVMKNNPAENFQRSIQMSIEQKCPNETLVLLFAGWNSEIP